MTDFSFEMTFHGAPSKAGVYMIRNRYDRKFYIGSSQNVRARWSAHKTALRRGDHHNRYMQNVANKYGIDAFEMVQIAHCAPADLLLEEQAFLDHLKSDYNLCAEVVSNRTGAKNTAEHKAKIAAAVKERWKDPVFRERQRAGQKAAAPRPNEAVLVVDGVTRPLRVWAQEAGTSCQLLRYRLKSDMTPEQAVRTPVEPRKPQKPRR